RRLTMRRYMSLLLILLGSGGIIFCLYQKEFGGLIAAVLLLGLGLFWCRRRAAGAGVEHTTSFGYICISLPAVESICLRAARRIKGLHELTAKVRYVAADTVAVGLRIVVDGDQSIPLLSEQLQQAVKDDTERITEAKVNQVSVYVAAVKQLDK